MAFRELVLEHSHAMFRLAWRLTCNNAAADDIVQEAFLRSVQRPPNGEPRPWLYGIALNLLRDRKRRDARTARVLPDAA